MATSGNIEDYIWKGPKVNGVQNEVRLMDCDAEALQKHYDHCMEMLHNNDSRKPGRLVLIQIIDKQIQCCRAELLVRWLRQERHYTYQQCYEDIRDLIDKHNQKSNDKITQAMVEKMPISTMMEVPSEYKRVPVGLVLKACVDSLGILDTSHITLNFLIKMGIFLTQQEMQKDLFERDPETGKAKNRLEIIKELEGLNPAIRLEVTETGLSYAEFSAMLRMNGKKDKYSSFTTAQLKILSEKVLYRFQMRCEEQARQWLDKVDEIKEVFESKGWPLKEYTDESNDSKQGYQAETLHG